MGARRELSGNSPEEVAGWEEQRCLLVFVNIWGRRRPYSTGENEFVYAALWGGMDFALFSSLAPTFSFAAGQKRKKSGQKLVWGNEVKLQISSLSFFSIFFRGSRESIHFFFQASTVESAFIFVLPPPEKYPPPTLPSPTKKRLLAWAACTKETGGGGGGKEQGRDWHSDSDEKCYPKKKRPKREEIPEKKLKLTNGTGKGRGKGKKISGIVRLKKRRKEGYGASEI